MRSYRLSGIQKIAQVGSALLPLLLVLLALRVGLPRGTLLLLALVALAALGQLWSIPLEMSLREDGALELRSALRVWVIFASEIRSIRASLWNGAYVTIRHESGKVRLIRRMDGIGDLLGRLASLNPKIRVRLPFQRAP